MARAYGTGSIFEIGRGEGEEEGGGRRWRAQRSVQTPKGRKYITGTGSSPAEAQRRLEANLSRWMNQGAPTAKKRRQLTDLTEAVWEYHRTHIISPNASYRQEGIIKNHLAHRLEGLTVEEVTPQQLRKVLHSLATEPLESTNKPLGSSGRRTAFYILKKTLDRALHDEVIERHPMSSLKPPSIEVEQDNHSLSERADDYKRIWRYLTLSKKLSQGYIPEQERWVLAMYGLRQSERLGLTWDRFLNLDTKKNITIIISQQLYSDATKGEVYIRPKTKSKKGQRLIPLDEETSNRFRRLRKLQQEHALRNPDWNPAHPDLVFTTENGGYIRQSIDGAEWQGLIQEVIPGSGALKGHAARHLFATMLAEAGVQEHVVSSLLGDSSAMVSYYTHIGTRLKEQALGEVGIRAMDLMINPETYYPNVGANS